MARPMPLAAPVTTATRPSNRLRVMRFPFPPRARVSSIVPLT